jgi:nucleoside-diphosphate-sugar epimerase
MLQDPRLSKTENAIFIIGASGFIGRHVMAELAELEWKIEIAPRIQFDNLKSIVDGISEFKRKYEGMNLTVLQAGWNSTSRLGYREEQSNFQWINLNSKIASTVNKLNIFAVFLGTCLELSDTANDKYTQSKIISSQEIDDYIKHESISWLRLFYIFSVQENRPRLLKQAAEASILNRPLLLESPKSKHDFISVRDTAKAIVMVLKNHLGGYQDVGTGSLVFTNKFIECIFPTLEITTNMGSEIKIDNSYQESANIRRLALYGWKPTETTELLKLP